MTSLPPYFATPEQYDQMYATFRADISVHQAEANAARPPVLEVCCGNGRILLPLAEAGVEIDGLDADAPMLDDLRRKAAERGVRPKTYQADMRDFTLPRRYGYVFIGFNTFGHNLTQHDQLRTLLCCREHLEEGGHLTLVLFHPSAQKLASFDGTPILAIEYATPEGGSVKVWDAVRSDRVEQVNRGRRRLERLDAQGRVVETIESEFSIRYAYKPEMELLLRVAGFKRWDVTSRFSSYAGEVYPEPRPPDDGGILVWNAWKD
jgi:SAM-dependent methyltransferase